LRCLARAGAKEALENPLLASPSFLRTGFKLHLAVVLVIIMVIQENVVPKPVDIRDAEGDGELGSGCSKADIEFELSQEDALFRHRVHLLVQKMGHILSLDMQQTILPDGLLWPTSTGHLLGAGSVELEIVAASVCPNSSHGLYGLRKNRAQRNFLHKRTILG
jgi:hypothetical protein